MDYLVRAVRYLNIWGTNYKYIDIYPSTEELIGKEKIVLRKNVINGPFSDIDNYLDTHFKLLREDFINPVRENICSFVSDPKAKLLSIKIHEIQFYRKSVKGNKTCYCLDITRCLTDNKRNINEDRKRFMMGSLLLFTNDYFKTIICGKVEETYISGKLLVSFEGNVHLIYNKNYIMVECNTFFEPYYNVLKILQNMEENSFPMEKYIVSVNTSIKLPKYLNGRKPYVVDSSLNQSQITALRGALSQEFALIQGPPGTGKTFLALKIAKHLLANYNDWWDKSPMLIVSSTNHALDQFLEGLLDSTDDILRLGGQSQSKLLQYNTIKEMRKKYSCTPDGIMEKCEISPCYKELRQFDTNISEIGSKLDNLRQSTSIFSFSFLSKHVSEMEQVCLTNETFFSWLLEDDGSIDHTLYKSISTTRNCDVKNLNKLWNNILSYTYNSKSYIITTCAMNKIAKKLKKYVDGDHSKPNIFSNFDTNELKVYYDYLVKKIAYLRLCLETKFVIPEPKLVNLRDPFKMPVRVRWQLYHSWLRIVEIDLLKEMDYLIENRKPIYKEYDKLNKKNTLKLMKKMKIIGSTTTYAARVHSTLESLRCPIVIVEEAADALESHIISALTQHCQHLILIGDHQQLKPTTSDYSIETQYKLGISLFERMVINNIPYHRLNIQHRMRPTICSLISPTIYPDLINHNSTHKYPNILGMDKNVFFIDHCKAEENAGDTSKKNMHEVKFLIQLAIYLLNNGYTPDEITVLATYVGQVTSLQEEQSKCTYEAIKHVKITSVDNFQGEENKIILLSLVRSNTIGFLSTKNRVCVALSRAKMGLYIMGNMNLLSSVSKLWKSIKTSLESQGAIGKHLLLKCQTHKQITSIKQTKDFDNVPDGGCGARCNVLLNCGHRCARNCHTANIHHCLKSCTRRRIHD